MFYTTVWTFLRAGKLYITDSPVASMTHLVFYIKVFFELFLNNFLVLIPNPIAARPKRLSVFLKIDTFKMAAWLMISSIV